MSTPTTVAVIGGGASGTLAAAHLAASTSTSSTTVDILLVDPDAVGKGLAYGTCDPRHRLNVPAMGMSAWPEDPGHFVRWLRRHVAVDFAGSAFAPRVHYAQYLADVLERALRDSRGVRFTHVNARVTGLGRHGRRLRLSQDDGAYRTVDAAVLALGHGTPSTSWAPPALVRSSRFVADPWRASRVPDFGRGEEIMLVGAGLTAADMAQRWGRDGVRVHVVSRHGMLPLPHAAEPRPAADLGDASIPATLPQARRFVFDAIAQAGGDWRRVIDGLRPHTQSLWQQFDPDTRQAFLRTAARRWDRVRHRVDPAVHEWLEQRRAEGALVVHGATVVDAAAVDGCVEVTLSDATVVRAAAVLNCTGTCTGVSASDDPLMMNLLASGLVQPGPLDLGFTVDIDGQVVPTAGPQPAIWTIGPLRRGQLWESTAIPEIRSQAAVLAPKVLATLPGPRLQRRARDPYRLPISANSWAGAR